MQEQILRSKCDYCGASDDFKAPAQGTMTPAEAQNLQESRLKSGFLTRPGKLTPTSANSHPIWSTLWSR